MSTPQSRRRSSADSDQLTNLLRIVHSTDRTAIYDRSQLRNNFLLVCGSENPDAHFAAAEIQNSRQTSNAIPEPEIRTAIELNARNLQKIDKLGGNFFQSSAHHHGRKAPSRGKLDQHRLTGFQNFGFEVRFVNLNGRFHTHRILESVVVCLTIKGRWRHPPALAR